MSNIGVIGAGKLGFPVSLTIESRGHNVEIYDVDRDIHLLLAGRFTIYKEKGLQPLLDTTDIRAVDSIAELIRDKDIVFCAVQTPHDPKYEGATPLPGDERKDFDYSYLKTAVTEVALTAKQQKRMVTLAVISTCLPGTFKREIEPLLNEYVEYVYTPQFIAMGTVVDDYLHPEFNLIGVHSAAAADKLEGFYATINDAPNVTTDITTAEGVKVSYNTWITAKTVIANAWGELSHRLGMNFDDLYKAWSLSTKRIISPKYMKAGMSDGGGCHPRDNIAMSYIARKSGMSYDIWTALMQARDKYEEWHAEAASMGTVWYRLPLVILGKAFKPGTDIQTGSAAMLMANLLWMNGTSFKHIGEKDLFDVREPSVFFLATAHEEYKTLPYPKGSAVIDPFRMMPDITGVEIFRIGENKNN